MAKKKATDSDKSEADKALEAKVDAMMDPKPAADVSVKDIKKQFEENMKLKPAESSDDNKIDVKVVSQKTAPELPPSLLKTVKEADKAEPVAVVVKPKAEAEAIPEQGEDTLDPEVDIASEATEEAVDDIVAHEGDTVLAVDDARVARKKKSAEGGSSWKTKLKAVAKNKWTWLIVGLLLVLLFVVPVTRYKILGIFIKRSVPITIVDSKSGEPVSEAQVVLAGASGKTDGDGKVTLSAPVGKQALVISKQQYRTLDSNYFVGFSVQAPEIKLTATGRLVPITIVNKVTGKPVANAVVSIGKNVGKTNAKGKAFIAVPVGQATRTATITKSDFNKSEITVQVTDQPVKANTFELTPAGKLYFLSNQAGKIDVVKTNLDGTERKVVFEGTGREQPNSTSLLASRDWRYLVLKARRDGAQPGLYLIDTRTDKITQFESDSSEIELIGWHDHEFVYSKLRTSSPWQTGRQQLKSYDAKTLQPNLLDQSQAEGDASSYTYQEFSNYYLVEDAVVYSVAWQTYSLTDTANVKDKQSAIRAVQPDGKNKKDYQTFTASDLTGIFAKLYKPQEVYFQVYTKASDQPTYYEFENNKVTTATVDQADFDQTYPTFLLSPTGNKTFWAEVRDGKNTLFTGDANADAKKQLAAKSDYNPYGWFSEDYLLVSKNGNELYITSASSLTSNKQPVKITDYYKPPRSFPGYGYGYGGL